MVSRTNNINKRKHQEQPLQLYRRQSARAPATQCHTEARTEATNFIQRLRRELYMQLQDVPGISTGPGAFQIVRSREESRRFASQPSVGRWTLKRAVLLAALAALAVARARGLFVCWNGTRSWFMFVYGVAVFERSRSPERVIGNENWRLGTCIDKK